MKRALQGSVCLFSKRIISFIFFFKKCKTDEPGELFRGLKLIKKEEGEKRDG